MNYGFVYRSLGQLANLTALIETVLKHPIGLELHCFGLVNLPPEELVALPAGNEAGL